MDLFVTFLCHSLTFVAGLLTMYGILTLVEMYNDETGGVTPYHIEEDDEYIVKTFEDSDGANV